MFFLISYLWVQFHSFLWVSSCKKNGNMYASSWFLCTFFLWSSASKTKPECQWASPTLPEQLLVVLTRLSVLSAHPCATSGNALENGGHWQGPWVGLPAPSTLQDSTSLSDTVL